MNELLASVHAFYRATSEDLGADIQSLVVAVVPAIVATYTAGYVLGTWVRVTRNRFINR